MTANVVMAHEIAKLLLERANTFLARTDAVKAAMELGMPLHEIEQYLDWLEMMRGGALDSGKPLPEPEGDGGDAADAPE